MLKTSEKTRPQATNIFAEVNRKRRNMRRLVQGLKDVKHPGSEPATAPDGCTAGLGEAGSPVGRVVMHPRSLSGSAGRTRISLAQHVAGPQKNSFTVLNDVDSEEACSLHASLKGKARSCVSMLSMEHGIKPIRDPPDLIRCGELRRAVRQCFPQELPTLVELSIKTSAKVEQSCCQGCKPRFDELIADWKEARFQDCSVDPAHLLAFKKAVEGNIPLGWNRSKFPFIPNGHGSLAFKRKQGGNWNEEEFSEECRVELVFSSGKPRIVTCYSAYNSRILYPLHRSLYGHLERKGWLLVGDPTNERVINLNGGGDYLSFDYVGATDNIKIQYVQTAIQALIDHGEKLSEDEIRCLRVLGNLKLDGKDCKTGQPMGSLMSFPLLCLINKAVVDLSLTCLLTEGKISFKEWTSHRCLINGDDLLLKEPRSDSDQLRQVIALTASAVGMKVNEEKTLKSRVLGEINSTLFLEGKKEKKVNVSALYMRPEVNDVLGLAWASTKTTKGFRRVVRANCHILSKQLDKHLIDLPFNLVAVCRKDTKIRAACLAEPISKRTPGTNFFHVIEKPSGYDLSRSEEIALINDRVDAVRALA
nr:MAG: RNA-dependent RNA polymerase [Dracophyllum associated botourmia-like virus 108]